MADRASTSEDVGEDQIAIIGMSGRFPSAPDITIFWQQLCAGVSAITPLSDAEVLAAGVPPALVADPRYVKAGATLDGVELFDAAFFGYTPREAELIDPQQRLFLECAWEALEHAGYSTDVGDRIGVYAGVSRNSYLLFNLLANHDFMASVNPLQLSTSNDKDYLATRVSYKLNLKGPSINVQTACSTSLVAVHLACESLLNGECELALAGGVTISVPQAAGYLYQEGGMQSPDGHCRAFDANAQGTVFGNGLGVVVLKRLEDALDDNDHVLAVIRGSAINNDGAAKVGYTAPSVEGQAQVIALAHTLAGVTPDSISYIEAHGTGTPLGDPIEIAALAKVFRQSAAGPASCAIGSVKTNIGHLDTAAGIAGLIKTTLALKHQQIPPSLHFGGPNPQIPFAQTPFYVNTELRAWPRTAQPRRAGVSSFGIGGTNAHVILEEAPVRAPSGPSRPLQLVLLSASTPTALDAATANLAQALAQPDAPPLPDAAYTLQVGRHALTHRRMLVCHDTADAVAGLSGEDPTRLRSSIAGNGARPVAFVFPGQGTQYVGMAAGLYADEPVFRQQLDQCADLLEPLLGHDLRALLFAPADQPDRATEQLTQTALAQPALFAVEYALAQLWISWGITPQALFGHSLGEFVAATLAGVFTLPDALALVVTRGQLMQSSAPGAMLSVALAAADLGPLLPPALDLAAVNGPQLCVVSGPHPAIAHFAQDLQQRGVETKRLHTAHAFHSALLDPILAAFAAAVGRVPRQPPQLPVLSNRSGTWLTGTDATDPHYWAQQLRAPVQCAAALTELLREPTRVLLELGPGTTLTTLARQQPRQPEQVLLATLPPARAAATDRHTLLRAAGQLWLAGVRLDWAARSAHEQRQRVPLPTYPFQRQRYWIAPTTPAGRGFAASAPAESGLYLPTWQRSAPLPSAVMPDAGRWLVLGSERPLAAALEERLRAAEQSVVSVRAGAAFAGDATTGFTLDPGAPDEYRALLAALDDGQPIQLVDLWGLDEQSSVTALALLQALAQHEPTHTLQITIVASHSVDITGTEGADPNKAGLLGLYRTLASGNPQISCRVIDLQPAPPATLADQLLSELAASRDEPEVAYRGVQRWVPAQTELPVPTASTQAPRLRPGSTYLLYGSDSALGHGLVAGLAQTAPARLILLAAHDSSATIGQQFAALSAQGIEIAALPAVNSTPDAISAALAQVLAPGERLDGVLAVVGPPLSAPISLAAIAAHTVQQQIERTTTILHALNEALEAYQPGFRLLCSADTVAQPDDLLASATAHVVRGWAASSGANWLTLTSASWPDGDRLEAARAAFALVEQLIAARVRGHVVIGAAALLARPATASDTYGAADQQAAPAQNIAAEQYARPHLQSDYVAPRNEIEQQIAVIWQTSLGIEQVGVYDNFFELGGHSLIAAQLMTQLREAFQIEIPLSALPDAPTVAALAQVIAERQQQQETDQQTELLKRLAELSDEEVEVEMMRHLGGFDD